MSAGPLILPEYANRATSGLTGFLLPFLIAMTKKLTRALPAIDRVEGFIPVVSMSGGKHHLMTEVAWLSSSLYPHALCGSDARKNGWSAIPLAPGQTVEKSICVRCLRAARERAKPARPSE